MLLRAKEPVMCAKVADPVSGDTQIPTLLRAAPHVRSVLDRYGLRGCGGPTGPAESLEFFAKAHDVPLGRLLDELRAAAAAPASPPAERPTVNSADVIYRRFF